MNAPILVLGAHRSGTSALNRVLGALGVFTGARRDPNDEAWFFLRLNEWLLRQAGARWDTPEPLRHLLAHREVRALAVDYLRRSLDSPRSLAFLGLRRYLRHRGISRLAEPWGFKDPRTTFTLPLWRELFPTARVLHIWRHGVDVAASLRQRQLRHLERSRHRYARNLPLLAWWPKHAGFTDSVRCATLEGAFELWELYEREARTQLAGLGERAHSLAYEELVDEPRRVIAEVAAFCRLPVTPEQIGRAAGLLRRDRAGAHRDDPELLAFAARVSGRVAALSGAGEPRAEELVRT